MPSVFEEVRNGVTIAQAISYLGLKPTETKGDQLRFPCPKCGSSDRRTLSVNLQRGFRCFSSDKKGDDATALVAHCLGIRNGEAAQRLKDTFLHSATEAKAQAKAKGRGDSANAVSPLELLGIDDKVATALGIEVEDGRVVFVQRDDRGVRFGTLAIATRADLPLIEWTGEVHIGAADTAKAEAATDLRSLWRVVKGGA